MFAKGVATHRLRNPDPEVGIRRSSEGADRGRGTLSPHQVFQAVISGMAQCSGKDVARSLHQLCSSQLFEFLRKSDLGLLPFLKWGPGAVDWGFLTHMLAECPEVSKWLQGGGGDCGSGDPCSACSGGCVPAFLRRTFPSDRLVSQNILNILKNNKNTPVGCTV